MQLNFDVVIIGAGCAGMTAAIYLKRSNINVVMIEGMAPGGQINKTSRIDNYPGYKTIDGPTLASNIFMQTQELGIPFRSGTVTEIIDKDDYKIIKTDKEEITCKAIIVATGRKPRELGLDNEKKLIGKGISWCALCDGAFFKNKDVVVVGGGNSALEESLYLSNIVNKVTLIHRRNEFRGDKTLQSKVLNNEKIEIIYDSIITKLNDSAGLLESVEVENKKLGTKQMIKTDGLFIYIGFEPATEMFNELGVKTEGKYLVVDENMRTNIEHVYGCGDVIKKELYQIATAVGEGAKAAFSTIQDLKE